MAGLIFNMYICKITDAYSLQFIFFYKTIYRSINKKMESKIRPMQELNKQIADTKSILSKNEGLLACHTLKYSTPQKQNLKVQNHSATTQARSPEIETKGDSFKQQKLYSEQITNYVKNLKKLCTSLQQKCYGLQLDYRKNLAIYQYKEEQLQSETAALNSKLKQTSKDLSQKQKQVAELQKINKQKQSELSRFNQQIAKLKSENVQLKMENKTYKADNKVIMNHIERLKNQVNNPKDSRKSLQERQYRVMKSLYQVNPNFEHTLAVKRYQTSSQLSNRVMLDQSIQTNADLKSLIRRLNQQIQVLKRQKDSLLQQCKIRTQNLEAQKKIGIMKEQSNQKLNLLIIKMGDKIMNLEQYNQSLRNQIIKLEGPDESEVDNYFRITKNKVGQFYYKK